MDRDSFGRQERRHLRELAGVAWERELAAELTLLADQVDEWRAGQLGPHELSDRIHTFHNGAARELYGLYTRIHPSQLVARAVAHELLAESDLAPGLAAKLAQSIEYYRADRAPPVAEDAESDDAE
jgi:hypothetical protein